MWAPSLATCADATAATASEQPTTARNARLNCLFFGIRPLGFLCNGTRTRSKSLLIPRTPKSTFNRIDHTHGSLQLRELRAQGIHQRLTHWRHPFHDAARESQC